MSETVFQKRLRQNGQEQEICTIISSLERLKNSISDQNAEENDIINSIADVEMSIRELKLIYNIDELDLIIAKAYKCMREELG